MVNCLMFGFGILGLGFRVYGRVKVRNWAWLRVYFLFGFRVWV